MSKLLAQVPRDALAAVCDHMREETWTPGTGRVQVSMSVEDWNLMQTCVSERDREIANAE